MIRSIKVLAIEFPDKTGKELFEIQHQDKLKEEQQDLERREKNAAVIKEINENGGYFFGEAYQKCYTYDHFTNLRLNDRGEIICDSDTILFTIKEDGGFSIERKLSTGAYINLYGLNYNRSKRITKEQWEAVNAYVRNTFTQFCFPKNQQ